MRYFDEAKTIWKTFVPKSGQADTVQGELLRAVEKLRDEAQRNGNANWDDGFDLLLAYLRDRLLDPAVFDAATMASTVNNLDALANYEAPLTDDTLFDALSDRVVEYFRYYGSQPNPGNPQLKR